MIETEFTRNKKMFDEIIERLIPLSKETYGMLYYNARYKPTIRQKFKNFIRGKHFPMNEINLKPSPINRIILENKNKVFTITQNNQEEGFDCIVYCKNDGLETEKKVKNMRPLKEVLIS